MKRPTSRIAGFYQRSIPDRRAEMSRDLSSESAQQLARGGLEMSLADSMSENVISTHGLPLSVGLNVRVNERDYRVPMAIEEPSVVAAASNAAKLIRLGGGFHGEADPAVMTAQIQFDDVADPADAAKRVAERSDEILAIANDSSPRMVQRGGGAVDLSTRIIEDLFIVHVYVDVGDAMGANLVDTVAEAVAPTLHDIVGGSIGLRILSNVPLRRLARASARVSASALGSEAVAAGIARASRFAQLDPLRAATHNKGIMNGIDAVCLALGQDWRAVEAGAHAFAALDGNYGPLATWKLEGDELVGRIELPLALGTVGGSTRVHPGVRAAFELIAVESARELAVVVAAVGLASNLAALKALAGEGIQRGHMRLHRRKLSKSATNASDEQPVGGER